MRLLIDAFAILSKRLPAARLVVIGDGDDRPALMAYARARGLERLMIWAGRSSARSCTDMAGSRRLFGRSGARYASRCREIAAQDR
ncbi:MAG: hypothetical protein RMJ48_14655 [Roseiflexaceae bacterium]|nr:hypothetical protein [Roseiflexaceae bacterium]